MVAMAQDYGADIRLGGVYAVSTGTACGWRGGAGDTPGYLRDKGSVSQQVIWFPPLAVIY